MLENVWVGASFRKVFLRRATCLWTVEFPWRNLLCQGGDCLSGQDACREAAGTAGLQTRALPETAAGTEELC